MAWSRRSVVLSLVAGTALGCGLSGQADPPEAPAASPRRGRKAPRDRGGSTPAPSGPPVEALRPQQVPPPRIQFAETPDWFRGAPALNCPGPRTAGSTLLMYTEGDDSALSRRISHFRQLPELHASGAALGADLLYLIDYYEGHPGEDPARYCWNKGSYEARADMGGAEGLKRGIAAVQEAGGRVILYLEPFIIHKTSELGKRKGEAWAIKNAQGQHPPQPYPDDYKMCPANEPFRDHMLAMVRKLIGEYGADGIHLDSYGYQRDWKCHDRSHGHPPGDKEVFNDGMKSLIADMREAALAIKSDAVLMCEGPKVQEVYRWVGASQDWGLNSILKRWCWNQAGAAPVFSSGLSLDDMHHLLALGHRLSLVDRYWAYKPEGTLDEWFRRRLPASIPDKKDERFRRFYAETYFRKLHQHRNAGIAMGLSMPNLRHATPRRGEAVEDFRSHEGMVAILEACRGLAPVIDDVLASAGEPQSPADHLKTIVTARGKLSRHIKGAQITEVDVGERTAASYRFASQRSTCFSAVNVGSEAISVQIPGAEGAYRDLVSREQLSAGGGKLTVSLPPHSLRLLIPARS